MVGHEVLDRRREELREALQRVPGLRLRDAYRGTLDTGMGKASVLVETPETVRVRLKVTAAAPPAVQRALPGNLRFARCDRGLFLVADIHTGPGIVESFEELDRGVGLVTGKSRTARGTGSAPETAALQAAVDALPWGDGVIVKRDNGHEVRLRIGDSAVPVQVVSTETGVHVHRQVTGSVPDSSPDENTGNHADVVEQAIGDQVHRLNARLRWARLTASGVEVTAEAHVPTARIHPHNLANACRAVAAAARHANPLLAAIAHGGEVARQYFDLFLNPYPGGEPR